MKAVILAGGLGTRLGEETDRRPKPMIEVGGRPLIWHILKHYSTHGINDFIICLGYKGYAIKEYFANYLLHMSDVTLDLQAQSMQVLRTHSEPWKVTLVDTGQDTLTGGRIKRILSHVNDAPFCMTYGDGVSNVDITKSIELFHERQKLALVTTVQMPGRFGTLELAGDDVVRFREKPEQGGWINGGFFVLSPGVEKFIAGDAIAWEREPLEQLAAQKQLSAHYHSGFWQCMDTARDKALLEELWERNAAPWKTWS